MSKLSLISTAVVLLFTMGTSWSKASQNNRFQTLKQEMWVHGVPSAPVTRLGEQPLSIEQIAQNQPQIAEVPAQEPLPEELDYVLHKFGHKL